MADDSRPAREEVRAWIKAHGVAPDITMTWAVRGPDPVAYQEVLEILFGPPPRDVAA